MDIYEKKLLAALMKKDNEKNAAFWWGLLSGIFLTMLIISFYTLLRMM